MDELTEREVGLIDNCIQYAHSDPAGLPGHNLMIIIAKLAVRKTSATAHLQDADEMARRFHEAYERLAPEFGYETRKATAVAWADVPDNNKSLMIAVCAEILGSIGSGDSPLELLRTHRGKHVLAQRILPPNEEERP